MQDNKREMTSLRRRLLATMLIAAACAMMLAIQGWGLQTAYADPDDPPAAEEAAAPEGGGEDPSQDAPNPAASTSSASSDNPAPVAPAEEPAPSRNALDAMKVDVSGISVGNDVFASEQSLESTGIVVPANLFASGQTLRFRGSLVGADAFIAGETVTLENFTAGNNLFVAGNNLTVSGAEAMTLFIAGNNLNIDGTMNDVFAAGQTVFLKGTFEGDVDVNAANVIIDPYLTVKGTLNVTAEEEPAIASTAKIGSFNFNQSQYDDSGAALITTAAIGSAPWLWSLLMMFLGMLLLGVLMLALMRTEVVDGAGRLVKERPLALFVSGILTLILVPVAVAILFISGVGWTVAVALILASVVVTLFAGTFTAISLGRTVLGRINKWVSSVIFIAVFSLLFCLPIVNFVLGALCTLYFAGSIIQGWWVWRRRRAGDAIPPDDKPLDDFTVPRGNHATAPSEQAIPPVPAAAGIPSTNPEDYRPRAWNE